MVATLDEYEYDENIPL